jgi:TonB family protein
MASTTISIARLRQLRVPVAWQEAVEVARLAGVAAEQRQTAITLDGCLIGIDGSVEVTAPYGAGGGLTVMQLLGTLLDGQSAPPELVTLVMVGDEAPSGLTAPGQARPKGLSLEWFVQPNPEAEVARLAARAVAAESTAAGAASLAELRAHVAEQVPAAGVPPPPTPSRQAARPWMRVALAAAAVTIAVGAAWAAWTRGGGAGIAAAVESWVAPAAPPADVPVSEKPGAPAARAAAPGARNPSPGRSNAATRPAAASTDAAAGLAVPSTDRAAADAEARPHGEAPTVALAGPEAESDGEGATFWLAPGAGERTGVAIYTAQDVGVAPPTIVHPKLPSAPRPDSPPSDSYVDVVVDERGQVVQVRLRSSEATVNDRMILAAVKTWQFEPARKNGVPVMYVLRVPATR